MRWLFGLAVIIWAIALLAPPERRSSVTDGADENAKLDAEIAHALNTKGVYTPKNVRKLPPPSDLDQVKLTDLIWSKTGFGAVMEASFTVRNQLPHPVKDITVQCDVSGESGTTIGRPRRVVYKRFPPGNTRVTDFNMGFISDQARRAGCEIVAVQK